MQEYLDVYDQNKKKTGKVVERDNYQFQENEYHLAVQAVILNSKNEILISKRAEHKKFGLMWECNGGAVLSGETSLQALIRELKEELGLEFSKKEAIYLKEIKKERPASQIKELWLFRKDIKLQDINFNDGESIDVKWVTIEQFIDMYNNKEIVPTIDFYLEDYNKALVLNQRESYGYIGKKVQCKIDRKLNSKHPKHGFIYELNYGYIPNTISGDGEELDCYIVGVNEPLDTFEGICIAVIHRLNDDDDKLIIAPDGKDYSDDEIIKLTKFQEQYFESEIIR